jgi:glycosyltransferase involved in cell wall biosynthesis
MNPPPDGVAAHLILGAREEPFLGAMLASIADAASLLIVNDNSPDPSPHTATLAKSRFGQEARLLVDRTPFSGFANARNVCLRIHEQRNAGGWIAFVDADEVHGPAVHRIAQRLGAVPADYDFVDGYTWHFFGSFEYYTSIERRMMFFRHYPGLRWEGAVHERLLGTSGKRIALPYVYAHYGHTLEPRRHAEKGRHYSSLGAPGDVLSAEQLDDFDVVRYFRPVYPRLLYFGGGHPPAARETLDFLKPKLRLNHELTAQIVRSQPINVKVFNIFRRYNYQVRWRGRLMDPLSLWLAASAEAKSRLVAGMMLKLYTVLPEEVT